MAIDIPTWPRSGAKLSVVIRTTPIANRFNPAGRDTATSLLRGGNTGLRRGGRIEDSVDWWLICRTRQRDGGPAFPLPSPRLHEDPTAMIRHPLGLRIDPAPADPRADLRRPRRWARKGVVLDAIGDLAPHGSARRAARGCATCCARSSFALSPCTCRPAGRSTPTDQLDERIRRADGAFALAYELGTDLVLARVGAGPAGRRGGAAREVFTSAVASLGQPRRPPRRPAGHRDRHRAGRVAASLPRRPGPDPAWPPASTPPACSAPGSTR